MEDEQRTDTPDQNGPPRKRPWWISGTTLKNSRNMAIWYSVIFVAYAVFAIVAGTRNPWTIALCFLWGILAAWAWLSVSYFARDRARVVSMLEHDGTDLIVARDGGRLVGMATLASFPLPTGVRGHLDDVVDQELRGRGIARLLLEAVIELARERGLRTLDLTSRPSRESAIRLYESVGFQRRDSMLMRYSGERA